MSSTHPHSQTAAMGHFAAESLRCDRYISRTERLLLLIDLNTRMKSCCGLCGSRWPTQSRSASAYSCLCILLYFHQLLPCCTETFLGTVKLLAEFMWCMRERFHHKHAVRKLCVFLKQDCVLAQILGSKKKKKEKQKEIIKLVIATLGIKEFKRLVLHV